VRSHQDGSEGKLRPEQFNILRDLLYQAAGISIADHKAQMVENRLSKRIKELSIGSFDEYIAFVSDERNSREVSGLVNALTTNVTHFFREGHHFRHLATEVEKMLSSSISRIRIWSAACSIGAEPYSVAMTLHDLQKKIKKTADIKILATDIDTIALRQARSGSYMERNIKGLSNADLHTHFTTRKDDGEAVYAIHADLRRMVSYNYFNFNERLWPMSGPFDFIFCRNVLIYFGRQKQREYVSKLAGVLRPGGFLYLGHSEHAVIEDMGLKTMGQTIYQKS
jgi:chemotaxis protein methyltransferase CheR